MVLSLPSPASAEERDSAQNILLKNVPIKIGLPPLSPGQGNTILFWLARTKIFKKFPAKPVTEVDSSKMMKFTNLTTLPMSGVGLYASPAGTGSPHFFPASFWQLSSTISSLLKCLPGNVLIPVSASPQH